MNSTKRKLYESLTWHISPLVYRQYGYNHPYEADEHTSDIIELVKEQLRYDIKYKCKK